MSTKVEEVKVFLESRHGVYQFESVIIIPSTQRHRMLQNLLIDGTEFPTLDNDEIGEFVVQSFFVSHDVHCVGFNIYENKNKVSIVTDLGYTTKEVVERLYDSRLVILEANHDEKMLIASTKYPAMLKNRILSNKGHLSNLNSAKVVVSLAQHNVKQILFAHLSEETNTPELCYKTVCEYLITKGVTPNIHIKLDIAKPYGVGPIYVIK